MNGGRDRLDVTYGKGECACHGHRQAGFGFDFALRLEELGLKVKSGREKHVSMCKRTTTRAGSLVPEAKPCVADERPYQQRREGQVRHAEGPPIPLHIDDGEALKVAVQHRVDEPDVDVYREDDWFRKCHGEWSDQSHSYDLAAGHLALLDLRLGAQVLVACKSAESLGATKKDIVG